jgi:hypothetical protein
MEAVTLLTRLAADNKTMRYHEFGKAVGLIAPDGKYEPWHRQQVADILILVAAVEAQAGPNTGKPPLQFERVVGEGGEPGAGFHKTAKIVRE